MSNNITPEIENWPLSEAQQTPKAEFAIAGLAALATLGYKISGDMILELKKMNKNLVAISIKDSRLIDGLHHVTLNLYSMLDHSAYIKSIGIFVGKENVLSDPCYFYNTKKLTQEFGFGVAKDVNRPTTVPKKFTSKFMVNTANLLLEPEDVFEFYLITTDRFTTSELEVGDVYGSIKVELSSLGQKDPITISQGVLLRGQ